jgi:hypothetical protein
MVIKKTKISTITAAIATIAIIAALGSIGGMGLGQQQQTALAQPVDPRDIGEDVIDLDEIGGTVRDILAQGVDEDERVELCPAPLIFVAVPGPQRYVCVDPNLTMNPLPDFP